MKKLFLLFIAILCLNSVHSQDIVAVAAGDFAVKDILNKFNQDAQILLNNANSDGNALLSRMANELNVASQNANLLLAKDMDVAFNKLDDQNSRLLSQIDQIRMTALHISNGAYNLKDATVLDLRRILGDYLPFSKTTFYIQRVDGISQIASDDKDYTLNILGIGFGFDSDNLHSRVTEVDINNHPITSFKDTKVAANNSLISIPHAAINTFLRGQKISQINVLVKVEVSNLTGFIFKTWKKNTYSLPLVINIIPSTLNNFTVNYTVPNFNWVTKTDPITYSYTTPDHDQHDQRHDNIHVFTYDAYQSTPTNQRYINPRIISAGGSGCPWTKVEFVHVEENGTKLHAQFSTWGLPCAYTYGATLQEFKQVGSISAPPITLSGLKYGDNLVITIPNTSTYWEINGQTIDFSRINIIQKASFQDLIVFSNIINDGVNFKIIYKIGYPL